MARQTYDCPICHSELLQPTCDEPTCRGWSDEQWALQSARQAYAVGAIATDELERRIETALSDPPRRRRERSIVR